MKEPEPAQRRVPVQADWFVDQAFNERPKLRTAPQIVAAMPPSKSQTALSVGFPVKNRETSELNESVALTPQIIKAMPTPNTANPIALFIMLFLF